MAETAEQRAAREREERIAETMRRLREQADALMKEGR